MGNLEQTRMRERMDRAAEYRRERRRGDWSFLIHLIGYGLIIYFVAKYVFHLG